MGDHKVHNRKKSMNVDGTEGWWACKLCTNWWKDGIWPLGPVCVLGHPDVWNYRSVDGRVSDRQNGADVEVGVGSDEEHSLMDFHGVKCHSGRCVIQCSIWNKSVGGMKLIMDLAVSPPYYSLILLPYNTQCAC